MALAPLDAGSFFAPSPNIQPQSDSRLSLWSNEAEILCCGDDPESVGVTHTSLPTLHNHYRLALGENLQLQSLEYV